MVDSSTPLLSVVQTRDGVWSVNERGPARVAIAYFPSKWGAMRHAVRVAMALRRCRVAILERGGVVTLAHEYRSEEMQSQGMPTEEPP
ncbi:MAG TPA: hypothetical protein VNP36_16740 [Burkholderiales bacterium]|nr:hypothetical protein [Burkholderiales bacterium]